MSKYKLGRSSKKRLEGVHPDMVRVVERAIEITKYDFGITEGLRSYEKQVENVEDGVSLTMKTLHFKQEDGYVHAVDIAVYAHGKITWDIRYYRKVIQAFFTAAIELGVQVEAGGLWFDLADGPHFQLAKCYR